MASFSASVVNLIINVLGVGILMSAWALSQISIIPGVLILCLVCAINVLAFVLLAWTCTYTHSFSYLQMGQRLYGPLAGKAIQWVMLVHTFFSCIQYLIFIGTLLPPAIMNTTHAFDRYTSNEFRSITLVVLSAALLLPLSQFNKLDALKYTSVLAFGGIMYVCGVVAYFYHAQDSIATGVKISEVSVCWGPAVPVFSLAFCAHFNGPAYFKDLEQRSVHRFGLVASTALGICLGLNIFVAILGYLTFGSKTLSVLLESYDDSFHPHALVAVAKYVFSIVVAFTFPLMFHAFKNSLFKVFFPSPSTSVRPDTLLGRGISAISLVIITTIAVLVQKITVVTSYLGAITGSCIVYIFPALLFIRAHQRLKGGGGGGAEDDEGNIYAPLNAPRDDVEDDASVGSREKVGPLMIYLAYFTLVWGILLMVVGVLMESLVSAGLFSQCSQG